MMTTNLFVTANVKKIANLGSFRILLPFFSTSWCVRVINSAIFNSFHNRVEFGTIFEGLSKFRGGVEHPKSPPPRYATGMSCRRKCWFMKNVVQRMLIVGYGRFGTAYWS